MKKVITILVLALVTVCLFSACSSTLNSVASEMSHLEDVKTMLSHLSSGDLEKAADMLHADVSNTDKLEQISNYLNGRSAKSMTVKGVNVKSQTVNGVTTKQESATLEVTLDDNEVVYLAVTYLENNTDEGFASFQLVLGVV